ncbi:SGNH/GDSL hydrolase family protein [Pseudoduganella sp. UC29_106]|uniref:SGNH/GDSL hydrolase family protein n=1 Tax=Pseudoduganella sp. UC29_106 TaxID=3374553 RepID=UPI0037578A73
MNSYLKALACATIPVIFCVACAEQQAVRPAAVNTDPAKAQVVLPEPANAALPSLILIGDSTVRNGHDDGQGKGAEGQWGWGNPIAAYFDPSKINVVNRAVGGLSSRTYLTSGHWERTLHFIKPGDVVIMQFGHNDSSALERPVPRARHDSRVRRREPGDRQSPDRKARDGTQLRLVFAHVYRRNSRTRCDADRGVADSAQGMGLGWTRGARPRRLCRLGGRSGAPAECGLYRSE